MSAGRLGVVAADGLSGSDHGAGGSRTSGDDGRDGQRSRHQLARRIMDSLKPI